MLQACPFAATVSADIELTLKKDFLFRSEMFFYDIDRAACKESMPSIITKW